MSRKRRPLFLERDTYRTRRMADAARVLPVFGVVLLALPILWTSETGDGLRTTQVMGYIFGVWLVLALLAAGLSAYLTARPERPEENGEDES